MSSVVTRFPWLRLPIPRSSILPGESAGLPDVLAERAGIVPPGTAASNAANSPQTASDLYRKLVTQPVDLPRPRPDIAPGAYEQGGQVQSASRGRRLLGIGLASLLGGIYGPQVGAQANEQAIYGPYKRALESANQQAAYQKTRASELEPLLAQERAQMAAQRPIPLGGGVALIPQTGGGFRTLQTQPARTTTSDLSGLAPLLGVTDPAQVESLKSVPNSAVPGLLASLRPKNAQRPATLVMGDKTYQWDPAAQSWYEIGPKAATSPGLQRIVTTDENGNPVTRFVRPQEGQQFPAPAASQGGLQRITTTDANGNPVTRFVRPKEGQQFAAAPTADMRNREKARSMLAPAINSIRQLGLRVITENLAAVQKAKAAGRSVEAAVANDPAYRTYQDARLALAGNLAVAQQGSRPSDADVKAIWLPLVPDAFRDTEESARLKWSIIYVNSGLPIPPELQGIFREYTQPAGEVPPRPANVPPDARWDSQRRRWVR